MFGIGMRFQNPCSKDIEKEKHLFGKILRCYRDQYNSNSIYKYSDSKQERSFDPSNSAFAVLDNKHQRKQLFKTLLTDVVSAFTLYPKHLSCFGSKYRTYLTILKHSVVLHMMQINEIRWNKSEYHCNRFHKSCKMCEMERTLNYNTSSLSWPSSLPSSKNFQQVAIPQFWSKVFHY